MNLVLILALGESGALNEKIGGSEEQAKFGFPATAVTACRANFEKIIFDSVQIGIVSFLCSS